MFRIGRPLKKSVIQPFSMPDVVTWCKENTLSKKLVVPANVLEKKASRSLLVLNSLLCTMFQTSRQRNARRINTRNGLGTSKICCFTLDAVSFMISTVAGIKLRQHCYFLACACTSSTLQHYHQQASTSQYGRLVER